MQLFAPQYRKKRARRGEEGDEGDEGDEGEDSDNTDNSDHQLPAPPPPPFPHAPLLPIPHHDTNLTNSTNFKNPAKSTTSSNLRRTHLNLLSAVLHRCLHDHDYARAGRAWGMILRTQATHGHTVDLRNHARWGIGAEILLRRPSGHIDAFSDQGFHLAREYYDRLIVQYPARKQAPNAVDQRSFYPAMFSLWIQHVVEKSKHLRTHDSVDTCTHGSNTHDTCTHDTSTHDTSTHDTSTHDTSTPSEDAIQLQELAAAMEIASRLDDLIASPPFDKQPSLLLLRAHTALWTSDLILGNSPATPFDHWDPYPILHPPSDQLPKFAGSLRELRAARTHLLRAEENGAPSQRRQILTVDARLRELQTQMEKLSRPTAVP